MHLSRLAKIVEWVRVSIDYQTMYDGDEFCGPEVGVGMARVIGAGPSIDAQGVRCRYL